MWNVRLYYETGFNAVNIPDSPALLETMSHADFPALDILQGEHLASVNVKATRQQVKKADYMRLTDGTDTFYYIVQSFTMTSTDVATLSLAMDYFTMHGGVTGLKFLDGMIERHHVASADDKFGAFTEEDPMLVPSKELDFDEVALFTDMTSANDTNSKRIIETTLDLEATGKNADAIPYTTQGGDTVTVPIVQVNNKFTDVGVNKEATEFGAWGSFITPQTVLVDSDDAGIQAGIARARSLGIEDGILRSYIVPKAAIGKGSIYNDGHYELLNGAHKIEATNLNFEYANVKNKRVLYGSLNSFVMMSPANGNSVTFKPEDIAFDENGTQLTAPSVCMNADPRPDGMPYFRFQYYKKNARDFFLNALKGMEWANAPLTYSGKSGFWQAKLQHDAATGMFSRNQDMAEASNKVQAIQNVLGVVAGGAGPAANGWVGGNAPIAGSDEAVQYFLARQPYEVGAGAFSLGVQMGTGFANAGMNYAMAERQTELSFKNAYLQEAIGYISGNIVAPDLRFAMSETLRDFRGNGCIVYRYRPQASDIAKLDKVLTMYGYKDTMPLAGNESVLTNRAKFNYIKATGVSVAGNKPKWLRDGVAMQLSVGTRIWHVKPNSAVYTDGSNV